MNKYTSSLIWYSVLILISLFCIFFVWKDVDGNFALVSDGYKQFAKWMDIAWWSRLTYEIDLSTYKELYPDNQEYIQETKKIKNIIMQNIDSRIDKLWVSDYSRRIDSLEDWDFLVVEIGGVSDLDTAKDIIWKTVELEFKVPYEWDGSDVVNKRRQLAEKILVQASAEPNNFQDIATQYDGNNVFYHRYVDATLDELPIVYQENPDVLLPRDANTIYPTLFSGIYGPEIVLSNGAFNQVTVSGDVIARIVDVKTAPWTGDIVWENLYTIEDLLIWETPSWIPAKDPKSSAILNAAYFQYASVSSSQTWQPVVAIQFNDAGKEIFCNLTWEIIWKQMAIFVWWKLVTSPVIRAKICGWSAQIDGDFTWSPCGPENTPALTHAEWTRCIVDNLNEWALPAPLILSQEEKVSAALGESALRWSLIAAGVWLLFVFLYMSFIYGTKKWTVALLTLICYIIVLLGITKIMWYAYSLSGIAAILLSIGMWVDANVLIYERLKEEHTTWSTWIESIESAAHKSRSAIRDWNLTTFMIAFLLFIVGTNVFKWFGTMMMLNILLTLWVIVPLIKRFLIIFYRNDDE